MDCSPYTCAKAAQHRHLMAQLDGDAEDAVVEYPEIDAEGWWKHHGSRGADVTRWRCVVCVCDQWVCVRACVWACVRVWYSVCFLFVCVSCFIIASAMFFVFIRIIVHLVCVVWFLCVSRSLCASFCVCGLDCYFLEALSRVSCPENDKPQSCWEFCFIIK